MKYLITFLLLWAAMLTAQPTVLYCIKNIQTVGSTYEFDVYLKTDAPGTLLGDGIIYMDYNTTAFGSSVVTSGGLTLVRDNNGSILGSKVAGLIYIYSANGLLVNNNTASRFAVAWEIDQQSFAASLTATEQFLVKVQLNIVSTAEAPSVSFYEPLMENETYESTNTTALNVDITTCAALPVEGLQLFANKWKQREVLLKWITLREENTDFFDLEKENEWGEFTSIARVPAAGLSEQTSEYQYIDQGSMLTLNRYRVRLTDLDGAITFSNTVEVRIESGPEVRVFPNPASQQVLIQAFGQENNTLIFQLFDLQGRTILSQSFRWQDGNTYQVNLSGLPEGVYLYQVDSDTQTWNGRLILLTE